MSVHLFEVGGHVRDSLLGIKSKDIDFAVETDSFGEMIKWIDDNGFQTFVVKPEFQTIRARFPKGHKNAGLTADFVLCRKDGEYSDGRRPDSVIPGTIFDDLARRDFTVNAMARDMETGELIDPWGGRGDLNLKRLRAVGNAYDRFIEDSLRVLRAIRFEVTKGLKMDMEIIAAIEHPQVIARLKNVSPERKREEMAKCFKHNTNATLDIFDDITTLVRRAIFTDGLRLDATLAA